MDYEKIAQQFRKKRLDDSCRDSAQQVNYTEKDLIKILPHRRPFLLIDSINSIDLVNQLVSGKRRISADDPVFKGHFPDYPLYPGVLQLEMIFQIGAAAMYFATEKRADIAANVKNVSVRATRINHALFQYEIYPDDELTIIVKKLYDDDFILRSIGQVVRKDQICTVLISTMHKLL